MSIRQTVLNASAWTLVGFCANQIIRLSSHLILARLLTPDMFGMMALVTVFVVGLEMFSDFGVMTNIIQSNRGLDESLLNTAWTLQITRGVLLWIMSCLMGWPYANVFLRQHPSANDLIFLIPIASFITVIQGFNSTQLAIWQKNLNFRSVTILDLTSQCISISVAIVWAHIQPSVLAFIAGSLSAAAFKLIASHVYSSGYRHRIQWHPDCVVELIGFGKWIFLSTLFTFLSTNIDRVILGNFLSLTELGFYAIASVFCRVPLNIVSKLMGTVFFSLYSKQKNDLEQMLKTAIRTRSVVLAIGMSSCLVMAICSRLFFETFWDYRYQGIAPIVHWLSIYVWSMVLLSSLDRIPLALGNSRALFLSNIARTSGIILATFSYPVAGLPGFIISLSCGALVGQAIIVFSIPTMKFTIVMQSMFFTVIGLLYGLVSVAFSEYSYSHVTYTTWVLRTGLLALVPICFTTSLIYRSFCRKEGLRFG